MAVTDSVNTALESIAHTASGFITINNLLYLLSGLFLIVIALIVVLSVKRGKIQRLDKQIELLDRLICTIQPSNGIEKSLDGLLDIVCPLIPAYGFSFYIFDHKNNQFVLKAVRYITDEDGVIGPSYSGLLPYKKETYIAPVSIAEEEIPEEVSIIKNGNVPLLVVPVKGKKAFIRIGPVHKVPKREKALIELLALKLEPVLNVLIALEDLKTQVGGVVAYGNAMHNLSNIVTDDVGALRSILTLSSKTVGAAGGFFIKNDNGFYRVIVQFGLDSETDELFKSEGICKNISEILGRRDILILKKGEGEYFRLPAFFAAASVDMLILLKVDSEDFSGVAGFLYDNALEMNEINEYRITALMMMIQKMGDIVSNQIKSKELADSYTDTLKMLAQMMDDLSPYTIGYSELMCRYSTIICMEMSLSREEIQDVSIAAYLSNIGTLGLSENLFNKEGKYTELEYEMMKLHSEVGASIVETLTSNSRAASYIRYHHERIDGCGYPTGLKGDQIPTGAKILAVVQTFLAKIGGRKDREPLSFERAIELLRTSSGSQLDREVVNALIGWFKKKQLNPSKDGRSLGRCWEMRCSPQNICEQCPAYKNNDKNCWEFGGKNCFLHGNKCSTCFIYTEYLNRKAIAFTEE